MSSNKISKTEEAIKSLEIKTKEEDKKLFKDDVLDKFNFWIYVAFIILGLILLISLILLIFSIFSSSSSSIVKPKEPIIINNEVPKVNINPVPVEIPKVKPVVNLPPPTPIPIIKKVEEPKPSFFSNWFSSSKKPTSTTTTTNSSLPSLESNSNTNKNSSFFSFFSNRKNIPKPTDNKITGGKYRKGYKNYRNNYK
jgi:hypothetical protein